MNELLERVLRTMRVRRAAAGGDCVVCGRRVGSQEVLRLRGGATAHRGCATYRMRQLGGPRRRGARS